jgi:hypothetical protein
MQLVAPPGGPPEHQQKGSDEFSQRECSCHWLGKPRRHAEFCDCLFGVRAVNEFGEDCNGEHQRKRHACFEHSHSHYKCPSALDIQQLV